MFPGGRSSQYKPDGSSGFSTSYLRDVATVSNPAWFGNTPSPVPAPTHYPPSVGTGQDVLAESYERMRNEMRTLQGKPSSKDSGSATATTTHSARAEEKTNPLTQLLQNRDVSLSSLLEAAMDPNIGSSKRKEDPIMKKAILDKCEGKIAQLYRLRISGQGMFFPMTPPKAVEFDGFSTLTHNHPHIEFNMAPQDAVWMCPDVEIYTPKKEPLNEASDESAEISNALLEQNNGSEKSKSEVVVPTLETRRQPIDAQPNHFQVLPPRPTVVSRQSFTQPPPTIVSRQPFSQPPPVVCNVSYPLLSQYRNATASISVPFVDQRAALPNTGSFTKLFAEMEKEQMKKIHEREWDRLMEDKERKENKRKKRKRGSSGESSSNSNVSRRSRSGYRSLSQAKSHRSRSHSPRHGKRRHRRSLNREQSSRRSRSRGRSHRRSRSRGGSHRRSRSRVASHRRSRSRGGSHRRSRSRGGSHRRSRSRVRSHRRSRTRKYSGRSRSFSLSPSPVRIGYLGLRSPRGGRRVSPSFIRSLHAELERSPLHYRGSSPRRLEEYHAPPIHPYTEPPLPPYTAPPPQPGFDHYGPDSYSNNPPPPGMGHFPPSYGPGPPFGPPHWRSGPQEPWVPGPWMDPGPRPLSWDHLPPNQPPIAKQKAPNAVKSKSKDPSRIRSLVDVSLKDPASSKNKGSLDVVDVSDDEVPNLTKKHDTVKGNAASEKQTPPKLDKEVEIANRAEVISPINPPGVSPDRETPMQYPNVESEFTRPMRAQFRKMLEPINKVLNEIRLFQRDSFDFKTLIKTLEAGKIEFMGVHTLHDGLLCKLEINRKHSNKFFKVIIPFTHVGRILRSIHATYHDYSIGKIQRLVDDLFWDPKDFPLSKIVTVLKQCKECIERDEKERDASEKSTDRKARTQHKSPKHSGKDKKRSKDSGEGKSTRDTGGSGNSKDRDQNLKSDEGGAKTTSSSNEDVNDYSKFEDLGVSPRTDDKKTLDNQSCTSGNPEKRASEVKKSSEGGKNGTKVVPGAEEVLNNSTTGSEQYDDDKNKAKLSSTADHEDIDKQKSQLKNTVNPDDFKERVRTVQMAVEDLRSFISDLEGLGKKCSDPALVIKAGMLCRRLPTKGQGKPEVKIVVTPACFRQIVEIVHTMASVHTPFQKTVTVFKKHFVPIDGLENVVTDVLNNCDKCRCDSNG